MLALSAWLETLDERATDARSGMPDQWQESRVPRKTGGGKEEGRVRGVRDRPL